MDLSKWESDIDELEWDKTRNGNVLVFAKHAKQVMREAVEAATAELRGKAEYGDELQAILMGQLPIGMCTLGPRDALLKLIGRAANSERETAELRASLEAAEREVTRLEGLVYVPGVWKCAKCNLSLIATTLHANSGDMSADKSPQQCANGCGPMWRVTERDAGNDLCNRLDTLDEKLKAAQRDAARYRCRKEQDWKTFSRQFPTITDGALLVAWSQSYDTAIDAAIAKESDANNECWNCGTPVPPGCNGLFKSDGDSCQLNRKESGHG